MQVMVYCSIPLAHYVAGRVPAQHAAKPEVHCEHHTMLQGEFLHNMLQNQKSIVNSMAVNEDGVLASGADNGSLW